MCMRVCVCMSATSCTRNSNSRMVACYRPYLVAHQQRAPLRKWWVAAHRVGNVALRAPLRPRFPHHTPVSNHPVHLSLPKSYHQPVVASAALIQERTEMQNVRVVLLMVLGAKTAEAQVCVDDDSVVAATYGASYDCARLVTFIPSYFSSCDDITLNAGETMKEACCASCTPYTKCQRNVNGYVTMVECVGAGGARCGWDRWVTLPDCPPPPPSAALPPPPSPYPPPYRSYYSGSPPSPYPPPYRSYYAGSSSTSDTSDGEDNNMAIIFGSIAGGIVLTIVSIIFCTITCSLKCYGIVVLVLACLTLVVSLVSILTFFGIPATVVTIVASLLAIPGSSIIACGCCKRPDGQPPIAAGILCLLSFLLRLVALALSLVFSLPAYFFAAVLAGVNAGFGVFIAVAVVLCIVLTVASGLSELILCIKCLCSQCCASITTTAQQGGQAPTGEVEVVISPGGAQMVSEAGIEIAMIQAAEAGTSHAPLTKVHSSVFHKRAAKEADAAVFFAEEARKAAEAKTEASPSRSIRRSRSRTMPSASDAADVADVADVAGSTPDASPAEDRKAALQQAEVTVSEPEAPTNPVPPTSTDKEEGAQSLATLLASCGLEHRAKVFEDERYTLEHLISAVQQGQEVAKLDLRELKLTLGECRKLITKLEAR